MNAQVLHFPCFQTAIQLPTIQSTPTVSTHAIPLIAKICACQQKTPKPFCSRRALFRFTLGALVPLITKPTDAASANSYFDKYDNYSSTYENLDGTSFLANSLGFTALRSQLLSCAAGKVLEVGVGTGVNLPFYDYDKVSSITGLDLSTNMLRNAKRRASVISNNDVSIDLVQGRAEDLPFPADTFDTVVDTFSLCVFPDPIKALSEMTRVIKKSSRSTILLLEHTRSPNAFLGAYQDITAEPTAAMSKGCYPNQNVVAMVKAAGCSIRRCEYHLAGTVVYLELGVDGG